MISLMSNSSQATQITQFHFLRRALVWLAAAQAPQDAAATSLTLLEGRLAFPAQILTFIFNENTWYFLLWNITFVTGHSNEAGIAFCLVTCKTCFRCLDEVCRKILLDCCGLWTRLSGAVNAPVESDSKTPTNFEA